ncbi:uncharacterized protein LOC131000348 [Salvia miltiorrhiza]|uniref:uncharacterized protein LOC131000348 n=1 Tax=Salvia miltiorrhiza TaxID=226208 RepID=UPI0025AC6790|nr:uncharacterized protein LOC131000348 [Salvia miltiorrhiza]
MRRPDLTTAERNTIVQFLLHNSNNGKPKRGKIQEAIIKFGCSRRTVRRLWAAARKQYDNGEHMNSVSTKIQKPRRKRVQIDLELISSLELSKRSTIRRLAVGINCSKSTVGRWVNKGLIRAHTSAIKPDLTAPNKLLRLRFSLEAIEYDRILKILQFKSMHNTVHIDEKWFYITKTSQRFYLTPEEAEPHRTCKSKKFITKVMFICAVCRPIFAPDGSVLFDGKIGIFPFTEMVPAQRKSKNREAGTLEQKPIQSITKEVIKDFILRKIIPAIKQKWPAFASKVIFIQQDNARPHIKDNDPQFREAASADGFDIRIVNQPPNSPDTNINDLGWFRAIQSLQNETACNNVDSLVKAVEKSFEELSPTTLNNVFLSLQGCMVEIMKVKGQNSYKIPHMKKGALIRANQLPLNLEVPAELVRECISYLMEQGIVDGMYHLMNKLRIANYSLDGIEYLMNNLGIQQPPMLY